MGFEPTTSSMPSRRAPNCATAPPNRNFVILSLEDRTRLYAQRRHFCGLVQRNEFENCGIRQDCDQRSGQRRVVDLRRNQLRMQRDLSQDEREFSDLSKADSYFEGSLPGIREGTDDARPYEKFSYHDQSNQQSQYAPAGKPSMRIDEHANGDKKESDEGVADRKRLLGQLVSKVRAAEQEASKKGAEGQREPNCFRYCSYCQTNREREKQRDFVVAGFLDAGEQTRHELPSGEHYRHEKEQGLGDLPSYLSIVRAIRSGETGQ